MRVVFAASEVAPFAKTGGLADVAGSLPAALADLGVEMTVMMPCYREVRESGAELRPLDPPQVPVALGPHTVKVGLESARAGRARVICLRYDAYFDRPALYGENGSDYPDNAQRFGLFSRAVIEASDALGLRPDVYHVNDWQTALVPAYLKTTAVGGSARARSVLTIHNVAYQGLFWKWDLPWTGLGWEQFTPEALEFYDRISFLKAGIVFADAITAVSPTYAREVQSSAEFGRGLEGVLRSRAADIVGIVNGVDGEVWNPERDPHLAARYWARDTSGKAKCKAALQAECGLPVREEAPLVGLVGRLTEQKGLGLVPECVEDLLRREPDCQFVFLGTGEAELERALEGLAARHPESVAAVIGFDEAMSHRIEGGSDVFLMPSRYEPCGLNQLYSMIYGTIPVVRRTGGLADTVEDVAEQAAEDGGPGGTGFVFDEFSSAALARCLGRAIAHFRDGDAWTALVRRAMAGDWSWGRSAAEYLRVYERLTG